MQAILVEDLGYQSKVNDRIHMSFLIIANVLEL